MTQITNPLPPGQFTTAQTLVAEVAIESLAYLKQVSEALGIAIADITIGDIHRFQDLETPRVELRPKCQCGNDRPRKNGSRIRGGIKEQQWVCQKCSRTWHEEL